VLVEIEKPQSLFFKPGTLDFHDDFYAALDQIHRWRAWFEEFGNRNGFVDGTIRPLRQVGLLVNNPCHIKYILVMGRRAEVENNEVRMRRLRVVQNPADFKIMSYDSLVESLHAKHPLYLGVRKNRPPHGHRPPFSALAASIPARWRSVLLAGSRWHCSPTQVFPWASLSRNSKAAFTVCAGFLSYALASIPVLCHKRETE
jgi:Domain of unknown function (DUF4263)